MFVQNHQTLVCIVSNVGTWQLQETLSAESIYILIKHSNVAQYQYLPN